MTNNIILEKLSKIQALVNQGVEGEKENAKLMFDKMVKKYNLSESDLSTILESEREFKYSTNVEFRILCQVLRCFYSDYENLNLYSYNDRKRNVFVKLNHLDFITIETAYEYFRRHVKEQYSSQIKPLLKKQRNELLNIYLDLFDVEMKKKNYVTWFFYTIEEKKNIIKIKSKNYKKDYKKYKDSLDEVFFQRYCTSSKLFLESQLVTDDNKKETEDLDMNALRDGLRANIEGGEYNKQVSTGLYLNK